MSAELNKLVRKNSGYTKGPLPDKAKRSYQELKQALISKPCLAAVDFGRRFIVTTDASATHYGSCLSQEGDDGIERPCGYSSKLLSEKEANQSPGLRERAALLHALRHWRPYLVGKEFTLRTDHKPNLSVSSGKTKLYDTLTDEIMNYQPFKLEYLPGSKMFVDALSRPPNAKPLPRTYNPEIFCTTTQALDSLPKVTMADSFYGPIVRAMSRLTDGSTLTTQQKTAMSSLTLQPDDKLANKTGSIVIPKELRPAVLRLTHDQAGHFSHRYTLAKIIPTYTWPGIQVDVKSYCESCVTCNQANAARPRTKTPLAKVTPTA